MPIPFGSLPLTDETFSFRDSAGKQTHFAIGELRRWLKKANGPIVTMEIPEGFDQVLIQQRGAEQEIADKLPEEALSDPVIFAMWPTGTHVLLDGAHRALVHYQRGSRELKAYMLPQAIWEEFVIEFPIDLNMDRIMELPGSFIPHRRGR